MKIRGQSRKCRIKRKCLRSRSRSRSRLRSRSKQHGGERFKPATAHDLRVALYHYTTSNTNSRSQKTIMGHISTWDVSLVTDFTELLSGIERTHIINNELQGIGEWDVSHVVNMTDCFSYCFEFNQPLTNWNPSSATIMTAMFIECKKFNQPLNHWNVSHVEDMANMFENCALFNQPLNEWDVSRVANMTKMFKNCKAFNQPLLEWNVSHVEDMANMFENCAMFNQPLNDWDVSRVENMTKMFADCKLFNQPLNNWRMNAEVNVSLMFLNCESFDQSLLEWNVEQMSNILLMFDGCAISDENNPVIALENAHPAVQNPGIAYQVHNEFNDVNKQELISLLADVVTRDFSTMNNPNFVNYIKQKILEAIETHYTPEEQPPLITALNALYSNLAMTEDSQILTAEYRNLYGKALEFMLEQPAEVVKEYLHAYIQECAMAYGANVDVSQININNMSCVKGRFERLVMCMKTAMLVQCVENPGSEKCLEIYKIILKKVFGVNISDSAVVALDKNELIQKWNSEHLDNDEYKTANGVGDMTEDQRRDFFRNDFIEFMRSAYEHNQSLTTAVQSMIEQEANQLDLAGVFRNMMFGGRVRGRGLRHVTRKRYRRNRGQKRVTRRRKIPSRNI